MNSLTKLNLSPTSDPLFIEDHRVPTPASENINQFLSVDADGNYFLTNKPNSIIRETDPTEDTVGVIGQRYINTEKKQEWFCAKIENDKYTWLELSAGSGRLLQLLSIEITEPPTKTQYEVEDIFDPAGMVIKGDYGFEGQAVVTDVTIPSHQYQYDPSPITIEQTYITITITDSGVTKTIDQAITVVPKKIQIPQWDEDLTYTGSPITANITGIDSNYMTSSGVTTATNAGDYQVIFSLKDKSSYVWENDSPDDQVITWTIKKASRTLTPDPDSFTLNSVMLSQNVNFTCDGTGSLSATVNDGSLVTVAINERTATITAKQVPGTAVVTATITSDENYLEASTTITVTCNFELVYGVLYTNTASTKLTRTDKAASFTDPVPYVAGATTYSSPFDDLMPWSGIVRETDSKAGELVKIPKFWYKITAPEQYHLKIQISPFKMDGYSCSPAHMDRGDGKGERDYIYVSRYMIVTSSGGNACKSLSGLSASRYGDYLTTFRTKCHSTLGANYWGWDHATLFTIQLLYLVEFADWDSQKTIGLGMANKFSVATGYTDSMPYHTGTMLSDRTTQGAGTQYRWIEGLWDQGAAWVDGTNGYNNNTFSIVLNPANFGTSNGEVFVTFANGGYCSANNFIINETPYPFFIPSGGHADPTQQNYCPDMFRVKDNDGYATNNTYLKTGVYQSSDDFNPTQVYQGGLFALRRDYRDDSNWVVHRTMKLP